MAVVQAADSSTVTRIVERLAAIYRPDRIYLCGSAARGTAGYDSDYDFMVVVPDGTPRELRDERRVFAVLTDIDAPVDVLVWLRSEFDRRLHLPASFPSTIVREGKLVYAA